MHVHFLRELQTGQLRCSLRWLSLATALLKQHLSPFYPHAGLLRSFSNTSRAQIMLPACSDESSARGALGCPGEPERPQSLADVGGIAREADAVRVALQLRVGAVRRAADAARDAPPLEERAAPHAALRSSAAAAVR